jgi:hypothetical protein
VAFSLVTPGAQRPLWRWQAQENSLPAPFQSKENAISLGESETDGRQKARTVCTIGTQPVIPAVYGVKAPVGAIVRAFAAERGELLRDDESQRLATLEWATAERREAIADVRRELAASMEALRGERAVVVDDLRHIVDVVLLRVAMFLVAAVVLAPLVAHAYARIWPARWR